MSEAHEDPRMSLTITPPRSSDHAYRVTVHEPTGIIEEYKFSGGLDARHRALQVYVNARARLGDFSDEPAQFRCRIWCDGVEYFNNKDGSLRGHITGPRRPADRMLP